MGFHTLLSKNISKQSVMPHTNVIPGAQEAEAGGAGVQIYPWPQIPGQPTRDHVSKNPQP